MYYRHPLLVLSLFCVVYIYCDLLYCLWILLVVVRLFFSRDASWELLGRGPRQDGQGRARRVGARLAQELRWRDFTKRGRAWRWSHTAGKSRHRSAHVANVPCKRATMQHATMHIVFVVCVRVCACVLGPRKQTEAACSQDIWWQGPTAGVELKLYIHIEREIRIHIHTRIHIACYRLAGPNIIKLVSIKLNLAEGEEPWLQNETVVATLYVPRGRGSANWSCLAYCRPAEAQWKDLSLSVSTGASSSCRCASGFSAR